MVIKQDKPANFSISRIVVLVFGIPFLVSISLSAFGQQGTASVSGVVQAPDDTPIPGANLSYGQMAPPRKNAPAAMIAPVANVVTAADGSFSVQNLNAGMYLFCVSVRGGAYLDPCHWSSAAPTFTVTAGLAITKTVITLAQAQQVQVRVNDPQQNFAKEGTTPNAHLLLGVWAVSGAFQSALLVSSDSSGRNYTVTVPLGSPAAVYIQSGDYQLADSAAAAVASTGGLYQVTVPSSGNVPTLTFTVTGFGVP